MECEESMIEFLQSEVERLLKLIEEARKTNKDNSKYVEELVQIVVELDMLSRETKKN